MFELTKVKKNSLVNVLDYNKYETRLINASIVTLLCNPKINRMAWTGTLKQSLTFLLKVPLQTYILKCKIN